MMVFKRFQEDIQAFMARDPAARSAWEVALCYSGLHAIWLYRLAHAAWRRRWYLVGRIISQIARMITAVEIHPGARIGRRFVIDHGHGVVIGETSEIEDDVTLYQGVTLGGIAPAVNSRNQVNVKRHPTLKRGVIIGSGAQVLGPITIGENARVGANAVVTSDLPAEVTAVGIPARAVMPRDRDASKHFVAYGIPAGCPDPVLPAIEALRQQVVLLTEHAARLEGRLRELEGDTEPEEARDMNAEESRSTVSMSSEGRA